MVAVVRRWTTARSKKVPAGSSQVGHRVPMLETLDVRPVLLCRLGAPALRRLCEFDFTTQRRGEGVRDVGLLVRDNRAIGQGEADRREPRACAEGSTYAAR
jgi:hypothetical protein